MKMVLPKLPLNCFVFKIKKNLICFTSTSEVNSVISVELRHDLLSQDDYY